MAQAMKDAVNAVENWSDEQREKEMELLREGDDRFRECSQAQEKQLAAILKAHEEAEAADDN